jgi:hypothetical protein
MPAPFVSFQPSQDEQEALARAAELWGIEPDYWDIWGNRRFTSPETQKAILEALTIPCRNK